MKIFEEQDLEQSGMLERPEAMYKKVWEVYMLKAANIFAIL
jgi:hypothetical protein